MIKEEYIKELHDRNYSLYASPELEKQALEELHEQDYMIFDEDETFLLYEDYEKELKAQHQVLPEKRANDMSGVFLRKDSVVPMIKSTNGNSLKSSTSSSTLATSGILIKDDKQSIEKECLVESNTELHGLLDTLIAFKKKEATTSAIDNGTKDNAEQLLYLKMDNGIYRHCDAVGTYESSTNRFTIKAGSVITRVVSPCFEGMERTVKRNAFIAMSCDKRHNGYVIKKDVLFDSPGEATFVVLGRVVSGWDSWKNKNGHTMRELYKQ